MFGAGRADFGPLVVAADALEFREFFAGPVGQVGLHGGRARSTDERCRWGGGGTTGCPEGGSVGVEGFRNGRDRRRTSSLAGSNDSSIWGSMEGF
jgi:hypothetical protein